MDQIIVLAQEEKAFVDQERLESLYQTLGAAHAENTICNAVEQLAIRLTQANRLFRERDIDALHKVVRSLVAIAEQIGLETVARVARDAATCSETGDITALAAVLQRLVRIGETSLREIWDLQDYSL